MATTEYINSTNFKNYTKFYQENNLTLDDDIILVQDISAEDKPKMKRLETLSEKLYPTEAEKTEMTQLMVELISYMPTANLINGINARVYGMEVYLKEGVVIFFNQQKQEIIDIIGNQKSMGIYSPLTSYKMGNKIMYDGYGFISKVDDNLGHTPDKEAIDDGYWIRFTIKGDKGDPSLNISIKKGSDGSANYDNTITYNVGDACVYNNRLYYAKVDGVVGINPSDNTKWACAEKIWIGNIEPLDHFVIWWDTNVGQNCLKRYSDNNEWVATTLDGKIASGILNTNEKINLVGAINELKTNIDNIKLTADNVSVADTSNLFNSPIKNVENILKELFTSANSGKNSIASTVGNLTSSNTFSQINSEIQIDKNILATNLRNKGVNASGTDSLKTLANQVGNISSKRIASGTASATKITASYSIIEVNLTFVPSVIIVRPTIGGSLMYYYINTAPVGYLTDSITISGTSFRADFGQPGNYNITAWNWIAYE